MADGVKSYMTMGSALRRADGSLVCDKGGRVLVWQMADFCRAAGLALQRADKRGRLRVVCMPVMFDLFAGVQGGSAVAPYAVDAASVRLYDARGRDVTAAEYGARLAAGGVA